MQLICKGTFLDVNEPSTLDVRKRSRSVPALGKSTKMEEMFLQEMAYCKQLPERVVDFICRNSSSGGSKASPGLSHGSAHSNSLSISDGSFSSASSAEPLPCHLPNLSEVSTDVSFMAEMQAESRSGSKEVYQERSCEIAVVDAPRQSETLKLEDVISCTSSVFQPGHHDASIAVQEGDYYTQNVQIDQHQVMKETAWQPLRCKENSLTESIMDFVDQGEIGKNPGSMGHPELCNRACLYFASGACANKHTCGYCHLSHLRKPHFDKRARTQLAKMSSAEVISAMLPALKEKAKKGGFYREAEDLFRALDPFYEETRKVIQCTNSKSFWQTMHYMSFSMVVASFCAYLPDGQAETFRDVLDSLRPIVVAKS